MASRLCLSITRSIPSSLLPFNIFANAYLYSSEFKSPFSCAISRYLWLKYFSSKVSSLLKAISASKFFIGASGPRDSKYLFKPSLYSKSMTWNEWLPTSSIDISSISTISTPLLFNNATSRIMMESTLKFTPKGTLNKPILFSLRPSSFKKTV